MNTGIIISLAVLVIMVVMICTGKISLGVIGLFVMFALAATGVLSPADAYRRFNDTTVLLVASVFVFSAAIFNTGCSAVLGNVIYRVASKSKNVERFLIVAVALIATFASAVLPNTAFTAAMIPMLLAAAERSGVSRTRLLMTLATFATLGGSVSLLGSPSNLVGRAALEASGMGTLTFFDLTVVGLPIALVSLVFYLFTYKRLVPERYVEEKKAVEESQMMKLTVRQKVVLVMFAIFVLSVISESFLGTMPAFAVGMTLCALLVLFNVITEEVAIKDGLYDIPTWIFIVATLTLSDAFFVTGTNEVMTNFVVGVLGERPNELVLISVLFWVGTIMTQFMSNTGTAGILCPVAISVAAGLGADPTAAVVTAIIACCTFCTPFASPCNLICVAPGKIRFIDWIKVGVPTIFISYILCILILPQVWPMY